MEDEKYILIPHRYARNKKLSSTQKLLLGYISGFPFGEFYNSNNNIAKLLGVKPNTIQKAITSLWKDKYIIRELNWDDKAGKTRRVIKVIR